MSDDEAGLTRLLANVKCAEHTPLAVGEAASPARMTCAILWAIADDDTLLQRRECRAVTAICRCLL